MHQPSERNEQIIGTSWRLCLLALALVVVVSSISKAAEGERWVTSAGSVLAQNEASACPDLIARYNAVLLDVAAEMKSYAACVSNSHRRDDCFAEFSHLSGAQSEFEAAVADYQSQCR